MFRYIDTGEPKDTMPEKEELIGEANNCSDVTPEAYHPAEALEKSKPVLIKTAAPRTEELIEKNSSQSDSAAHAPASKVASKLVELKIIPDKSFAEIVKQNVAKVASTEANKQPKTTTSASVVKNSADKSHKTSAAALKSGPHSIYLSRLPINLTPSQLGDECKKFGAITADGVQVKTKPDGFTFGFVAFVTESSVQKALQVSPIIIMGKPAFVQITKAAPHGVGAAGGNMNARGGYHNTRSESGRDSNSGGDYQRGRVQ